MKKGRIIFFCNNEREKNEMFNYINHRLGEHIEKRFHSNYGVPFIKVNGYYLEFKTTYTQYSRGYKSEIVYISTKNKGTLEDLYDVIPLIVTLSQREEPMRFFNSINDIDIQELINDDYANKFKVKSNI